ncbi:uncharacterized protein LOC126995293 [Eriocheir sinensis]|uniref:uncharacterized protein LOC126995293 n=1 Tax=Eriocheir sinensis TaxID=95602 RepID=UPI0021C6D672|nr:uncharacterized protein LOC126995293 [Eriocheir sinensis]
MPVIKILQNDVFYALSGLNPQKAYGPDGVPPIVLKNCASVLSPCLVKLFRLCLSTSTFPSCWKYAFIQPVPKKGDRSNPSNYRPIALLSCLSKAFESILNRKIQKHFSTSDLLSDRQYGFRKGRSTGDLLAFLTDSWSSSLSRFGETFAIALDISKAFDRVWHKSLLSKLPSYGFYPSLCTFISSFLSDRSISAVVDGHCSSPKSINSGVPQGSVLSPTLFLLFIDDLLSKTNCPNHSYADDSTLHYSTSFNRRPTLQELNDSRLEAAEHLASDLTIISDWGKKNLVSFNASKIQFLHLSTRHNLPNNYPLFFDNTQLSPSSTLNILGLSLTQNLNWKLHISSLTKSASSRLGVLYCLRQFFFPAQLLSIYRGLVRPRMEYASHVWGGSTHTALLDRVEAKALRLISSPPHTDSLLPLKFRRNVASLSIFYRYFHADCSSELANCMPPPLPRPQCTRLSTHAHPYTAFVAYLELLDLVGQVEVRLPRVVPRDRQNPFTCLSEEDFIDRYHLSPACTLQLLENVQPKLPRARDGRGCSVPGHLQLLVALRFFASGNFQLTMADCLEMSAFSVCKFVHRIAVILARMSPNYIKFPEPANTRQVAEDFHAVAGMPGVIGCIDGTLIPIVSPGGNTAEIYRYRKGYLALIVMAVCDAKMRFTNVVSSWPGSVHDSRIFYNSRFCQKLEGEGYSGYLLGDSGYACKFYLLTLALDPQTEQENRYNASHIRTRDTIEKCFGVLKRRFAVLRHLRTTLETSKKIIIAVAVLHNIAVNSGMPALENVPEPVEEVQDYALPEEATSRALRRRIIEQWF